MNEVLIDDDFARFGAKSYAINKITSVEVREQHPHSMGCAYGLIVIAAFFVVSWLASLADQPGGLIGALVVGLIVAAFAFFQWRRAKLVHYQLFLITSAAETQAFQTQDHDEVVELRRQIETAMVRQSRRD